jgi:hypothetical protein
MRFHQAVSALALGAAMALPVQAAPLVFNPFVSAGSLSTLLSNNATIGYAYAGDKFVGSVYFGTNNNQLYSSNLTGTGLALFGAPIAGFSGEIYVSASLGIGGYGPRDVFAGSEAAGTVVRVAHDGSSQSVFATGLVGGVRSIAFDPYGLYGNQMVVATNADRQCRRRRRGPELRAADLRHLCQGDALRRVRGQRHPARDHARRRRHQRSHRPVRRRDGELRPA